MIKKLFARIKLDWDEYWYYNNKDRERRRTEKAIQTAVDLALMMNLKTGKTSYIFINADHIPEPMTRAIIKAKQRRGEFPKEWKFNKILEYALIIVSSQNEIIRHQSVDNVKSIMKK